MLKRFGDLSTVSRYDSVTGVSSTNSSRRGVVGPLISRESGFGSNGNLYVTDGSTIRYCGTMGRPASILDEFVPQVMADLIPE